MDLVPHLRGTVLDLPPVGGRAVTHPGPEVLAGDARIGVPPGFDTYLLVNVLHDLTVHGPTPPEPHVGIHKH